MKTFLDLLKEKTDKKHNLPSGGRRSRASVVTNLGKKAKAYNLKIAPILKATGITRMRYISLLKGAEPYFTEAVSLSLFYVCPSTELWPDLPCINPSNGAKQAEQANATKPN